MLMDSVGVIEKALSFLCVQSSLLDVGNAQGSQTKAR
jgi:hypothetical protein